MPVRAPSRRNPTKAAGGFSAGDIAAQCPYQKQKGRRSAPSLPKKREPRKTSGLLWKTKTIRLLTALGLFAAGQHQSGQAQTTQRHRRGFRNCSYLLYGKRSCSRHRVTCLQRRIRGNRTRRHSKGCRVVTISRISITAAGGIISHNFHRNSA